MRIILIDDDDQFRTDLEIWLTNTLKHTVGVADSVEEAKKQLDRERYDAILLDSHLRSSANDMMDSNPQGGLEMLRHVSTQVSKTVLVTAHNFDDLSDAALLGCDRFVFKSWGSERLHQKIEGHLGQLAVKRWNMFTTILGGFAIVIVAVGIVWQMVEQPTPALLAALIGTIVNLLSFLSILMGRPVYLLWKRIGPAH